MYFNKAWIKKLINLKTPCYIYDMNLLEATLKEIKKYSCKYNFEIHYALKANNNIDILKKISSYSFGADCVSGEEIKRALKTGFNKEKIVFAGVGKTDSEIEIAIKEDISVINCESIEELKVINELAKKYNYVAKIALRINPNVDAKTHKYITTGLKENKFGINVFELNDAVELISHLENIKLYGIHFHIGSQITNLNSFCNLCNKVNELQEYFYNKSIQIKSINVGGGLGVNYINPDNELIPDFKSFFSVFNKFLELKNNQTLHFELGRSVVAQCGSLLTSVLYVKNGIKKKIAIVDAGLTELLRPALYQAYHKIEKIPVNDKKKKKIYDIAGPICESSDFFAKSLEIEELNRGDKLIIRTTGAYGETMSSCYNLRKKAKAYYFYN